MKTRQSPCCRPVSSGQAHTALATFPACSSGASNPRDLAVRSAGPGGRRRSKRVAGSVRMAHDVEYVAVRRPDEEAAYTPRLRRQRVHDLVAQSLGFLI